VKSVNGRIKNKFKFFDDVVENSYFPKIGSYFQIACALLNAHSPPLAKNKPEDIELARSMLERVSKKSFARKNNR